jgi:predicted peroxiredoxin
VQRRLVVKIAGDSLEGERVGLGLLVAATAASSGVPVVVWLAAESVRLATTTARPDAGHENADLVAALREVAQLYVCARCAARRGIEQADLYPGVRIGGAAEYVEQVLDPNTQALIY